MSDAADRAIKDELIGGLVLEQKARGNFPDPERAKKWLEDEQIMEKADAAHERNTNALPLNPPEKVPDLRPEMGHSNLLDGDVLRNPDVAKREMPTLTPAQVAARMQQMVFRNWLRLVGEYDPQFKFDMKSIMDVHYPVDEHGIPRATEKGRALMQKLINGALDKYGNPVEERRIKRIQVG